MLRQPNRVLRALDTSVGAHGHLLQLIWGSANTTPDKYEYAVVFLRLGLGYTITRHDFRKRSSNRSFSKTMAHDNYVIFPDRVFLKQKSKMTGEMEKKRKWWLIPMVFSGRKPALNLLKFYSNNLANQMSPKPPLPRAKASPSRRNRWLWGWECLNKPNSLSKSLL